MEQAARELMTCPVTREIMIDPVMDAAGYIYERRAIELWFRENSTDPMTGNELEDLTLRPACALRAAISDVFPHVLETRVALDPEPEVEWVFPEVELSPQYDTLSETCYVNVFRAGVLYVDACFLALWVLSMAFWSPSNILIEMATMTVAGGLVAAGFEWKEGNRQRASVILIFLGSIPVATLMAILCRGWVTEDAHRARVEEWKATQAEK